METGEWKLRNREIELNAFFERLSVIYEEDCRILDKKYRYENFLPENVQISCDPVLFERALENLFVNSIKHTLSGTEIFFRAFVDNSVPVIELGDNGEGIEEGDLKYIFEPFYRGTNSRKEPGMGLGLSSAKSVLDAHGWDVSVTSEKGERHCFQNSTGRDWKGLIQSHKPVLKSTPCRKQGVSIKSESCFTLV